MQHTKNKELFVNTPPTRLFFKAAIPGAIGMLASSLYQTVDGILVGNLLGDTAFAAMNLVMPLVIINFSLADLIGVGSAVPISIRLGAKDEKSANNIFTCSIILIILAGLAVGGILYTAGPFLLHLMGAEGELAALAAQYMRVYALFSPLITIVYAMDNYLRICGHIRTSMVLNILMSALCVGLEWILLGLMGAGIWGSSLGSSLGMLICAALAVWPFARGRMQLRFVRPRFSGRMVRQIIACGSPNFLSNIAGRITSILMNMILLRLGGATAVSVYGILMMSEGFVQPLLYGMCDSLQPAVGYNWGAGNPGRVLAIEKRCFTASAVLSLAAAGILAACPEPIVRLFSQNTDGTLLAMAVPALVLFSTTFLTRWISFASQSFFAAIERPLQASVISVSIALVFPLIFLAVLQPLGLTGLWLNLPLTALSAAVLSAGMLLHIRKKAPVPPADVTP